MTKRLKMSHALTVLVCALLLVYQNCAQSPDSSSNQASEFEDGLDFAYDAKLDTIAYMSCSEIQSDMTSAAARRAYFTFRAGAYEQPASPNLPFKAGVMLTPKFRNDTRYYTNEARAQVLAASPRNGNTRLNFSFRTRANAQSFWYDVNIGPKISTDGFLPPMASSDVAGPLSAYTNGYLQYFPGSGTKRVMEASLNALGSEANAANLRNMLSSGGGTLQLVMGYGKSSDEMDHGLRTPGTTDVNGNTIATSADRAYGTAFRPEFGYAFNKTGGGDTRRVLSSIKEFDLTQGAAVAERPSGWQCDSRYQFMIVRPEDARTVGCATGPDIARTAYADYDKDVFAKLRRVLRTEDWWIDIAHRCIVPKGIDNRTGDVCYGSTLSTRTIDYTSAACNFFQPQGAQTTLSTTCPHYVSICVR